MKVTMETANLSTNSIRFWYTRLRDKRDKWKLFWMNNIYHLSASMYLIQFQIICFTFPSVQWQWSGGASGGWSGGTDGVTSSGLTHTQSLQQQQQQLQQQQHTRGLLRWGVLMETVMLIWIIPGGDVRGANVSTDRCGTSGAISTGENYHYLAAGSSKCCSAVAW